MNEWIDQVRVGDILLVGKTERVVRDVAYKAGRLRYATFTILNCSWTLRPYTVYTRHDLIYRGTHPTGKRYKFKAGSIDVQIWRAIQDRSPLIFRLHGEGMTCCAVKGVR